MEGTSDSSLQAFASTRISPAYLARVSRDSLMRALKALRAAPGGEVGGVSVEREGTGLRMSFMAQRPFGLHLELDDEGLIREITMGAAATRSSMPASPDDALWDAMTWENLTATVQRAAQQGFRGTVLARRDGKEVARLALGTIDGAGSRATSCAASFSLPRA